ncbi:MAG: helix-turn-helix transcriptional regulator [Bryobacteraceae bacterium]
MNAWSEEDVLALVGCIYDASLDPALWGGFLARLRALLGAEAAAVVRHEGDNPAGTIFASSGIDPLYQRAYSEKYNRLNVWTGPRIEGAVPDSARTGEMLCSEHDLVRSEFYQGFLKPQNIFHSVAACIKADRLSVPFCAVFRSRLHGGFGGRELALLGLLTPHLRRAFQLQERTAAGNAGSAAALAALDAMPIACLVTDKSARVLMANRTAEAILDTRDGLLVTGKILGAARQDQAVALRGFIYRAGTTVEGNGFDGGGAATIDRPSGRTPLQVLVIPYRGGANWPGDRPAAMVFVTDPEREAHADDRVLAAVFGLTRAEARVAALLQDGRGIDQCAEALRISRHTARNHLKSIFLKTGARRQGELVRMLLNSVARLSPPR